MLDGVLDQARKVKGNSIRSEVARGVQKMLRTGMRKMWRGWYQRRTVYRSRLQSRIYIVILNEFRNEEMLRGSPYDRSLTGAGIDSPKKMTSGFNMSFTRFSFRQSGQSGRTNVSYLVPSGRTT